MLQGFPRQKGMILSGWREDPQYQSFSRPRSSLQDEGPFQVRYAFQFHLSIILSLFLQFLQYEAWKLSQATRNHNTYILEKEGFPN